MNRSIIFLLLIICSHPTVFAQENDVTFERLTIKDGLSHNNVRSIM